MKHWFISLLWTLAMLLPAHASANDAATLVDAINKARFSEGFQARMLVTYSDAAGHKQLPFKVALIGKREASRQLLLLRGISPAKLHDLRLVGTSSPDMEPILITTQQPQKRIDTSSAPFGPGLIPWDLFTPWWQWSDQQIIGHDLVDSHTCSLIRSRSPEPATNAGEVISCVDKKTLLPWRTQIFDRSGKLLRTLKVVGVMRTQAGNLAAKTLLITMPDQSQSEISVYSGDEHYHIEADTFAGIESIVPGMKP